VKKKSKKLLKNKIKNKQLLLKRYLSEFLATEEIPFKEHHFSLVENFEIWTFLIRWRCCEELVKIFEREDKLKQLTITAKKFGFFTETQNANKTKNSK